MSQTTLAELAGISRRTVISLEAGEANISLASLDRLADALGTTFTALVRDPGADRERDATLAWRGAHASSRAELLASVPAMSEAQLWTWSLGPGDRYDAEPDPPGWREMVVVTAGRLRIEREDAAVELGPGEFDAYPSDQVYAYVNLGDGVTTFVRNVVA